MGCPHKNGKTRYPRAHGISQAGTNAEIEVHFEVVSQIKKTEQFQYVFGDLNWINISLNKVLS